MNKIHRVLWSKRINSWVVAPEHASSSGSKSRSTTSKVLLGSLIPFLSTMAYAVDECGTATAGASVICDSSVTGVVSYPNLNISLLLDGQTNGDVNLSGVSLNGSWSSTYNNDDLSLTTQGRVNIASTDRSGSYNNALISMSKSGGSGDLNLSLGSDTHLSGTPGSVGGYYSDAMGIYIDNSEWDLNYAPNTNVFLDKGATININSLAYTIEGIKVNHNTSGDLSFVSYADIQLTSNADGYAYMLGIDINATKEHGTIENHGDIILTNANADASGYGTGIKVSLTPVYTSAATRDVTLINTGNIEGDARQSYSPYIGGDLYTGIDAYFQGMNSPEDNFKLVNSGNISKVNYGIFANVQGGYEYDSDYNYTPRGMKGEVVHTGTIDARQYGILFGGGNFEELTVRTSGKIIVCSDEDDDCYTTTSSGGFVAAAKGIYVTSTSGGVVAAANVIVDAGSIIENFGGGAESAAVAVDSTQQVDISVSGNLRSTQGAGISLQAVKGQYVAVGPSGSPPFEFEEGKSVFNVELKSGAEVMGGSLSAGIESKGGNALNIVIEDGATLGALSDFAIDAQKGTSPGFSYWDYTGSDWEEIILPAVESEAAPVTLSNAGTITGNFKFGNNDDAVTIESSGVWNIRNFADTDNDGVRDTKAVAISDFGGGNNTVTNYGTISLGSVDDPVNINTTGEYIPNGAHSISEEGIVHGQLLNVNRFENNGVIDLTENDKAGNVLVITGGSVAGQNGGGTFVTNGGEIRLNSLLNEGGIMSQSDILVLDNVERGTAATKITIKPIAGSVGVPTVDQGIHIVDVKGTMDPDSFELTPLNYGEFGYVLTAGSDNNLYLTNYLLGSTGDSNDAIWNVNIGSHQANQYAAGDMFTQRLTDRYGQTRLNDDIFWARANYKQVESDLFSKTMDTKIQTTLVQLGADLYRSDDTSTVAGVFVGYGHADQHTYSKQSTNRASGQVDGYQVGVYGTWEPGEKDFYVDSWAYYALYKNKLNGQSLPFGESKYSGRGFGLSTEVGYTFNVVNNNAHAWKLQPQVQLTYTYVSSNDVHDTMGTHYIDSKNAGLQTRVGARFYRETIDNTHDMNPFVEVNWLHNSANTKVRIAGSDLRHSDRIGRDVAEIKLGIAGKINNSWSVWGHVGAQQGSDNFKRHELQFGLGYVW